jgi:predicted ATPase
VRLVTLSGPGGVGKSRLALEVAGQLGPSFADGVRFVDLAPVQSADLVVAAIAAGLGLRTSGGPLTADVKAYLRDRPAPPTARSSPTCEATPRCGCSPSARTRRRRVSS